MAGAFLSVDIDLDTRAAEAGLDRQAAALEHPQPLMDDIAQYLYNSSRERFRTQQAPDGTPWAALNPEYQRQKSKNQDKILTLNGYLSGTLVAQATDDEAVVGSNLVYAAIQQFGGTIKPRTGRALRVGGRFLSSVTLPARPYLGTSADDLAEINDLVEDYLAAAAS
ncbi:phage virion morphogenesis protein [Pigmentiphaga kullae]|uniref:Phage virion morphogenesis protein n=1 Tax=Pigmentiphaga kullae TaxID=151784 RepID=A0A4Q7NLV9_9BURK|nr:phage virion morphogenesis protein [Pigmentiphaga kullae]RZS86063.1 phage virion morphogenesis protein [Pigmentiphaga kullae]